MKIGIIREYKNPPDKRVVFSPKKCAEIVKIFEFTNEEFKELKVRKVKGETKWSFGSNENGNFIRAEAVDAADFIKFGSAEKCKENGKLRIEGKDYIVKDGDVLYFRVNP